MPERIQRKRTKGWKMPPNTVSVTRPLRHSNPFRVERLFGPKSHQGEQWVVVNVHTDAWAFPYTFPSKAIAAEHAVVCFESLLDELDRGSIRDELRGKNVACFCPLDQPCHADVLLKIANSPA